MIIWFESLHFFQFVFFVCLFLTKIPCKLLFFLYLLVENFHCSRNKFVIFSNLVPLFWAIFFDVYFKNSCHNHHHHHLFCVLLLFGQMVIFWIQNSRIQRFPNSICLFMCVCVCVFYIFFYYDCIVFFILFISLSLNFFFWLCTDLFHVFVFLLPKKIWGLVIIIINDNEFFINH